MITGFLGCCGSLKESAFMLFLVNIIIILQVVNINSIQFFLVLFLIFVLLMSAGLWAVSYKGKVSYFDN